MYKEYLNEIEGVMEVIKATKRNGKIDVFDDGDTVMPQDARVETFITKVECPSVTVLIGVPKATKF